MNVVTQVESGEEAKEDAGSDEDTWTHAGCQVCRQVSPEPRLSSPHRATSQSAFQVGPPHWNPDWGLTSLWTMGSPAGGGASTSGVMQADGSCSSRLRPQKGLLMAVSTAVGFPLSFPLPESGGTCAHPRLLDGPVWPTSASLLCQRRG